MLQEIRDPNEIEAEIADLRDLLFKLPTPLKGTFAYAPYERRLESLLHELVISKILTLNKNVPDRAVQTASIEHSRPVEETVETVSAMDTVVLLEAMHKQLEHSSERRLITILSSASAIELIGTVFALFSADWPLVTIGVVALLLTVAGLVVYATGTKARKSKSELPYAFLKDAVDWQPKLEDEIKFHSFYDSASSSAIRRLLSQIEDDLRIPKADRN